MNTVIDSTTATRTATAAEAERLQSILRNAREYLRSAHNAVLRVAPSDDWLDAEQALYQAHTGLDAALRDMCDGP
jgi:hypothetical protein